MIGVRAIWRRRLGVVSVTFFGPSRLHVAVPVAMFHLPVPADERRGQR